MDATMSESIINQQSLTIGSRLQLKKYTQEPFPFNHVSYNTTPTTPSEWFSCKFPQQAQIYGCPFIELVEPLGDGINAITPLAPNIDFFAALLGGDSKLGHKVVYAEAEMTFYYHECRDQIYYSTSEEKLGNLMRALLIRCAEELPNTVHKLNLFLTFRSDKTIRSIIQRAKSILAADDKYFSVDSKNVRKKGVELYERVARVFVEQVLERVPGESLTLTDAYLHFLEYLKKRNMPPIKRRVFKDLVPPAVKNEYDIGIRNDIHDPDGTNWTRGWSGLGIIAPEPVLQEC